jgi:hypothetical protein
VAPKLHLLFSKYWHCNELRLFWQYLLCSEYCRGFSIGPSNQPSPSLSIRRGCHQEPGTRPYAGKVRRHLPGHRVRMMTTLSAAFALATLLAAIGLFGVLAYTVAQRTREIGLRMALGATPDRVRSMVLRQVAIMTLVGAPVGPRRRARRRERDAVDSLSDDRCRSDSAGTVGRCARAGRPMRRLHSCVPCVTSGSDEGVEIRIPCRDPVDIGFSLMSTGRRDELARRAGPAAAIVNRKVSGGNRSPRGAEARRHPAIDRSVFPFTMRPGDGLLV